MHKATVLTVFENLGIPIATGPDKNVGPSTVVTVLGIEVDSVAQETRLPDDKLVRLMETLSDWSSQHSATKKDLLSLIGSLSFAAKVVLPGCTFIRCLMDLSCTVSGLSDVITLDDEAKLDIH